MRLQSSSQANRIITAVVGSTLLIVGVAMLALPGPGWIVIFFGLTILSAEFLWARLLLRRLKQAGQKASDMVSPSRAVNSESSKVR
ncbi:MAG: PGPGW domain-containing protein [Candidatus Binatus sp.]|uniref:PGPGW domain-containing protein n=1 Tax=Candidatus Binatus sp. TaxID=2811406 RepID=UPI002724C934|nr:PGPGW domain-containing protein [Candidatus Binatus sp.]MDO8433763.1 PGPGW domain-containing protein [Candidatus Binatus sp.]